MSKDKEAETIRILEDRLPTYFQREQKQFREEDNNRQLSRMADDLVTSREYSSSHPIGPIEFSPAAEEQLGELSANIGESNEHLSDISRTTGEIRNDLHFIREGSDHLPEMHMTLNGIHNVAKANLGATVIAAATQAWQMESLREDVHENTGVLMDISEQMYDQTQATYEVTEATYEVRDAVDELGERMDGSLEKHSDRNEAALEKHSDRNEASANRVASVMGVVAAEVNDVGDKISSLDRRVETGHRAIVFTIAATSLDIKRTLNTGFSTIDERLRSLLDAAKNKSSLEADERHAFALDHFKAKNYKAAIKELRKALNSQSTHLPSLYLLGKTNAANAKWANAKDTYYNAAQLALARGDLKAYESFIIELARLERILMNDKSAESLLRKARDEIKNDSPDLTYEIIYPRLFASIEEVKGIDFIKKIEHLIPKYHTFKYRVDTEPLEDVEKNINIKVSSFTRKWNDELATCFATYNAAKQKADELTSRRRAKSRAEISRSTEAKANELESLRERLEGLEAKMEELETLREDIYIEKKVVEQKRLEVDKVYERYRGTIWPHLISRKHTEDGEWCDNQEIDLKRRRQYLREQLSLFGGWDKMTSDIRLLKRKFESLDSTPRLAPPNSQDEIEIYREADNELSEKMGTCAIEWSEVLADLLSDFDELLKKDYPLAKTLNTFRLERFYKFITRWKTKYLARTLQLHTLAFEKCIPEEDNPRPWDQLAEKHSKDNIPDTNRDKDPTHSNHLAEYVNEAILVRSGFQWLSTHLNDAMTGNELKTGRKKLIIKHLLNLRVLLHKLSDDSTEDPLSLTDAMRETNKRTKQIIRASKGNLSKFMKTHAVQRADELKKW